MRIAIVREFVEPGDGISRVMLELAERLARRGHDVCVIVLRSDLEAHHARIVELGCIRGIPYDAYISEASPKKIKDLLKLLDDYDIMNSHAEPVRLLCSLKKALSDIPHVACDHGLQPWLEQGLRKIAYRFLEFTNYIAYRCVDEVIVPSRYLKARLASLYGVRARVIMFHGVDTRKFHPGVNGSEVREELGIEGPMVFYVGRIVPYKGVHYLIKAMRAVNKELPDARLVIGGKPDRSFLDYYKYLRRLADKNIIFTGYVPEEKLPKFYAACDVFATGTLWEGILQPEPFAFAKPIVAFNITSNPEVVKHGLTGLLVPPGDWEALGEAILSLLKDDERRLKMGVNARRLAEELFDWEKITDRMEEEFKMLIKGNQAE